jgi:putative spermidine/putrescine transport system permease protein
MHKQTRTFPHKLSLTLYALLVILPVVAGFVYAVLYSLELTGLLATGFTLRHWVDTLSNRETALSLVLGLTVAVVVVMLTLCLALPLALFLMRLPKHFRFKRTVDAALHVPLAVPAAVAALVVWHVFSGGGFVARVCVAIGIIATPSDFPSPVHDAFGLGIILTHTALAVPFFVLLFGQLYHTNHVERLEMLASTLGANPRIITLRVALPVLLRAAAPNAVLLVIAIFGSYEIPLLLGVSAPQMPSVLVQRKYAMFDLAEKPEAFVLIVLCTLLVSAALWAVSRAGALFQLSSSERTTKTVTKKVSKEAMK